MLIMFRLFLSTMVIFICLSGGASAQQVPVPSEPLVQSEPSADQQEQVMRSMEMMLKRAQMTRSLAAEHLDYIKQHREEAIIRMIEDASQVMAFDLICEDDVMETTSLNHIAADTSLKIAMMAGTSTIAPKLTQIAKQQTVKERMELIGDIATTVLMFEVGRRRGLFDALLTDFGNKRFCAGMETDMHNRYNEIIASIGQ